LRRNEIDSIVSCPDNLFDGVEGLTDKDVDLIFRFIKTGTTGQQTQVFRRWVAQPVIQSALVKWERYKRRIKVLDVDNIIDELGKIAYASIGDIVTVKGTTAIVREDVEADSLSAISGIEVSESQTDKGTSSKIKISMHNKQAALDALYRISTKTEDVLRVSFDINDLENLSDEAIKAGIEGLCI
jgi:hypothetical protein